MKTARIRPGKSGIRAVLFDLEADIMEIVWSKGWDRFAVSQVHGELERQRDIAYTTVMTTVDRLFAKELLTRTRQGKRYQYRPVMTRQEFCCVMAQEIFESLPDLGRETALALLVDRVSEADEEELDSLEALIRAKRQELEP
jgi:predicted transcriptional regulator